MTSSTVLCTVFGSFSSPSFAARACLCTIQYWVKIERLYFLRRCPDTPLPLDRMTEAPSLAKGTNFWFGRLCACTNAFKVSYRLLAFRLPSTVSIVRNLVVMQHDTIPGIKDCLRKVTFISAFIHLNTPPWRRPNLC